METETLQQLPSASWRPRKAGGVVQFEPEGLRTWEPWCSSRSESKARESGVSVSEAGEGGCLGSGRAHLPFLLFVLFGISVDRLVLNHTDKADFLCSD